MGVAHRFSGPGQPYEGLTTPQGRWTGEVRLVPEKLEEPLRWRRPRRVFVNSMSDLFHPYVPDEYIAAVFGVMAAAPQHTFQVLTKRPERARRWFAWAAQQDPEPWTHCHYEALLRDGDDSAIHLRSGGDESRRWPLRHVWIGVSVEDQATADARIPHLLATPAAVRWVSAEPLLGPVRLHPYLPHPFNREPHCPWCEDCIPSRPSLSRWKETREDNHGPFVDWVVVGGESGPGARPFDLGWARDLLAQCGVAGVSAFFKQAGRRPYERRRAEGAPQGTAHALANIGVRQYHPQADWFGPDWTLVHDGEESWWYRYHKLKDKKGGDLGELPEDLRVREYPEVLGA